MKGLEDLARLQSRLEEHYGAPTGLDIRDFVRSVPGLKELGRLAVQVSEQRDLDLALLLDRDLFSAWTLGAQGKLRAHSVAFEETSHFVYLAFNHHRGRDVTILEMEMQSEVDRIFLAFAPHSPMSPNDATQLLEELLSSPYAQPLYESARLSAASFVRSIGFPSSWSESDLHRLRRFFHSDLGEKLYLAQGGGHL